MKRFHTLKRIETYFKKVGFVDFFKFKGLIYTQENYDSKGKEISYKNKKSTNEILVLTENRYENTKDLQIEFNENVGYYRNDIIYFEEVTE